MKNFEEVISSILFIFVIISMILSFVFHGSIYIITLFAIGSFLLFGFLLEVIDYFKRKKMIKEKEENEDSIDSLIEAAKKLEEKKKEE